MADKNDNQGEPMSDTLQRVTCGICDGWSDDAEEAALAGQLDILTDWWGEGVTHTFPAPTPHTSHGSQWTRRTDGVVVHLCGTYLP